MGTQEKAQLPTNASRRAAQLEAFREWAMAWELWNGLTDDEGRFLSMIRKREACELLTGMQVETFSLNFVSDEERAAISKECKEEFKRLMPIFGARPAY